MPTTYTYTGQNTKPNIIRIQAGINNSDMEDKDCSGILWDEANSEIEVTFINALSTEDNDILDEVVADNKDVPLELDPPEVKIVQDPFNIDNTYATFKSLINSKGLFWQYQETSDLYNVFATEGPITYTTTVYKVGDATNLSDFETNYKAGSNKKVGVARDPLPAATVSFKGKGVYQVCTKNSTTNIDFQMPADRYLNGANWYCKDAELGDYFVFQVVDVDNLLGYGAGLVLSTWVEKWYVGPNEWIFFQSPTAGLVNAGFYLRGIYTSVGTVNDVKVFINYHLNVKL